MLPALRRNSYLDSLDIGGYGLAPVDSQTAEIILQTRRQELSTMAEMHRASLASQERCLELQRQLADTQGWAQMKVTTAENLSASVRDWVHARPQHHEFVAEAEARDHNGFFGIGDRRFTYRVRASSW